MRNNVLYEKMLGFRQTYSLGKIPEPQEIYGYFSLDSYLKPSIASFAQDNELILKFCKRLVDYSRENKKIRNTTVLIKRGVAK